MMRTFAVLWIAVVALAGGYLTHRVYDGLTFQTDLLALIPREERDPALQRANDQVTNALSRQVLLLIGHHDRAEARAAATEIAKTLADSHLVTVETSGLDGDRLRQIGELYYPYRYGLLTEEDRTRLRNGREEEIATRALSQAFSVFGVANAKLLQSDPFLLLPAFLTSLPVPFPRLSLDDGLLSLRDADTTWIMIAGHMNASPYAMAVQTKFTQTLDQALNAQREAHPGLEDLRLGAVFFTAAGAKQATTETSIIGIVSVLGAIALILLVFHAMQPLWLSLVVIGVGAICGLSASLWLFGELHIAALLFGVSLIGITVDYSLQYFTEIFAKQWGPPDARLRRVLPGITLGMASVLVGYLTLFLAPFPGLHQIAALSAIGLLAAWITVVLWLPILDSSKPPRHGKRMLAWAAWFWAFWRDRNFRYQRGFLIVGVLVLAGAGLFRIHADDDVRKMQSLSPQLLAEQSRIQQLIGHGLGTQYFLVQADDDEMALQREEALIARLRHLVSGGKLAGFQALAQYVPSAARQRENRALQERLNGPFLAGYAAKLGMPIDRNSTPSDDRVLTLAEATKAGAPFSFLAALRLDMGNGAVAHVVPLEGVADRAALMAATDGLPGIRLVDPATDFSTLLGKYRNRAIILLCVSLVLMTPLLLWRYGRRRGLQVLLAPTLAIALTPAIRALTGEGFTFFDAMALVLVLSVGIDYAVFVAETSHERRDVTLLAVTLAAMTTLLSFGMLAWSDVRAVHAFGATMLVGVLIALALVPLSAARDHEP